MDVKGVRVATGSKDTTVGVAMLTPDGIVPDRAIGVPGGSEAFHERVVKGVDLRDELTVSWGGGLCPIYRVLAADCPAASSWPRS